jgi:hypothetical protein
MLPTCNPIMGSPVITQAIRVVVRVAMILQVKVFMICLFSADTESAPAFVSVFGLSIFVLDIKGFWK